MTRKALKWIILAILLLAISAIIISSIRIESYPEEVVKYKDNNIKGFLKLVPNNIESIKTIYHRKLVLDKDKLITYFIWCAMIGCFVGLIICLTLSIIPYYKSHIKAAVFNKEFISKIVGKGMIFILSLIAFYRCIINYPSYFYYRRRLDIHKLIAELLGLLIFGAVIYWLLVKKDKRN